MPQRYNIVSEQHLADALIFSLRNGLIYSRFPSYAANSRRISVVRSKFIGFMSAGICLVATQLLGQRWHSGVNFRNGACVVVVLNDSPCGRCNHGLEVLWLRVKGQWRGVVV